MNSHPPSLFTGFNLEMGDRVLFFMKVGILALVFLAFGVGATAILTSAACAAMAYEWFFLTTEGRKFDEPILPIAVFAGALPPFMTFAVGPAGAVIVASLAAGFLLFMGPRQEKGLIRTAAGIFVIGLAGACFVWIRGDAEHGLGMTAWLVFVVVATELGNGFIRDYLAKSTETAASKTRGMPVELLFSIGCGVLAGIVAGAFYREGSLFWVVIASILTAAVVLLAGLLTEYCRTKVGSDTPGSLFLGRGAVIENFDGLVCASIFAGFMMMIGGAIFSW